MKLWRAAYGTIFAGLVTGGLIAAALNPSVVFDETVKGLRAVFTYVLPIQLGIIALFSVIERLLPTAGPRKPIKGYVLNVEVMLLERAVGALVGGIVGVGMVALGSRLGLGRIDLRFSAVHRNVIPAFFLNMFILDFFYYWFHRFQHETRFLWREHKLHHMDGQLCALIRESPLDPLLLGMALVPKLDPISAASAFIFFAWGNVLIHSNIRVHLGWASVLLAGPQLHRIHHSRVREHHDKNYAALFPVWDVIFGTYHHPKRNEYPLTGVHDEKEVQSFMAAAALPFREWWKMFHRWRARRAPAVSGASSRANRDWREI